MNNGKQSEALFEQHWEALKPKAYLYRFEDYADANFKGGRTRKIVARKPSDYLITYENATFYAEVKSVAKGSRFPLSNIKANQWRTATRVTKAGGVYNFYIHFIETNCWYKVPSQVILCTSKKSLVESELSNYKWQVFITN